VKLKTAFKPDYQRYEGVRPVIVLLLRLGYAPHACVSLHVADADACYREWSAKVTPLRLATRCSSLALSVDRLLTCAERREQASDGE
jgi:hypothetical protein